MQKISLHAAQDHIIGLTKFRTPIAAVEELLWNSLDADALNVNVTLAMNSMGGLARIVVADDGHGLPLAKAEESFGSIGGSPKLKMKQTPKGRRPHGKSGVNGPVGKPFPRQREVPAVFNYWASLHHRQF